MKYFSFLWPPIVAVLSILNYRFFGYKDVFEKELIKIEETATNSESSAFWKLKITLSLR
jgi:hypothetical protein